MSDITKKALESIQKKKIKPLPKWNFLLKRGAIWTLFSIGSLLGSISVAIIIYQIQNTDFDVYSYLTDSILSFILITLPYFWIILLIGFSFLSYKYFRKTKKGYKYNFSIILTANIAISIIFGLAFYNVGFARVINHTFHSYIPYYNQLNNSIETMWSNPEKGLLAGTIEKVEKDMIIIDFDNKTWTIQIQNADIKNRVVLEKGEKIKIIGEIKSENIFIASDIRPWEGRSRNMNTSSNSDGNRKRLRSK